MNFQKLAQYKETAILFSQEYSMEAKSIYDSLRDQQPNKTIYLIASPDVICSAKTGKYESYIVVGIECPLHPFENTLQFKKELPDDLKESILLHNGPCRIDKIYDYPEKEEDYKEENDSPVLIVSENQNIIDYYTYQCENVVIASKRVEQKNRVNYLLRENIAASKLDTKKMFGVVFTSRVFEEIADTLCGRIALRARAYKMYLKDISYERLISVDLLDCIVIVDCPVFQCEVTTHIPIVSPFTINTWLEGGWSGEYNRNLITQPVTHEIVRAGTAGELLEKREYKGVPYLGEVEDDTEIHTGRSGIAACYSQEMEDS